MAPGETSSVCTVTMGTSTAPLSMLQSLQQSIFTRAQLQPHQFLQSRRVLLTVAQEPMEVTALHFPANPYKYLSAPSLLRNPTNVVGSVSTNRVQKLLYSHRPHGFAFVFACFLTPISPSGYGVYTVSSFFMRPVRLQQQAASVPLCCIAMGEEARKMTC